MGENPLKKPTKQRPRGRIGRPRRKTPTAWGQQIDRLAEARGLSRRQLAERVGISQVSLWQFLMGKAGPSLKTAGRLADALGVPLDHLR